ncbi:RdRp [Wilkie partiti-like virus 1]|uniref:RdRp n=1 Tax=Wilkie partiti-like virus 1 TaxID=2010283 RepID=UPI000B4EF686|nr:RdRp [Wilkie partiti-like virus 1]ASA47451.1 RdRp [Wilkie partiti-like virus 1]
MTDFEFFKIDNDRKFEDNRIPKTGIKGYPQYVYHVNQSFLQTNLEQSQFGPKPMTGVEEIIRGEFMEYTNVLYTYCRPKADVDAVFNDFNKQTKPIKNLDRDTCEATFLAIDRFMEIQPYDIVHWCDTRFYKWNLATKVDYYHSHSKTRLAEAKVNHPEEAKSPSKKHWFINTHLYRDRTVCHNIKLYGYPFVPTSGKNANLELHKWFLKHPTEMLVRSHISKREKLKVRPVYCAPLLLLRLECMLFWPLLAQCRKEENCIMYGLETIRGGMDYINRTATEYQRYLMLDWSSFDQLAPFKVIDLFFDEWLPRKILVDNGYALIWNYQAHVHNFQQESKAHGTQSSPQPENQEIPDLFPNKVRNLISFVKKWYKDMIFITPDGNAYRRINAGVPSGILMTQFLDSWINLFVFSYIQLKSGWTMKTLLANHIFVMGDDNVIFLPTGKRSHEQLLNSITNYAEKIFGMKLNQEKSTFTANKNKIEVIGYTNKNGLPHRDIGKLVAQLAYPERHCNDEDMCMRAVGMAYASCGVNTTFYMFCKRVYDHYRSKLPLEYQIPFKRKNVIGIFKALPEEVLSEFNFVEFPTLNEIFCRVQTHQGFLDIYKFWRSDYFLQPPVPKRRKRVTLHEYYRSKVWSTVTGFNRQADFRRLES